MKIILIHDNPYSRISNGLDSPLHGEGRWVVSMATWLSEIDGNEVYICSSPGASLSHPRIQFVSFSEASTTRWDLAIWTQFRIEGLEKTSFVPAYRHVYANHFFQQALYEALPKDSIYIFPWPQRLASEIRGHVLPMRTYTVWGEPRLAEKNILWTGRHGFKLDGFTESVEEINSSLRHLNAFVKLDRFNKIILGRERLLGGATEELVNQISNILAQSPPRFVEEEIPYSEVLSLLQTCKFTFPCFRRGGCVADSLIEGCVPLSWERNECGFWQTELPLGRRYKDVTEQDIYTYIEELSRSDEYYVRELNRLRQLAPIYHFDEARLLFNQLLEKL